MSQTKIKTDLLIIGAGSGGLSLAAGAVQMGAEVILLEGAEMGGDCLNYGCVPSKALLAAAKNPGRLEMGFETDDAPMTARRYHQKGLSHVQKVIAQIAPHDSQDRFERLGVAVLREFGRFVAPDTVRAGKFDILARRVVIATGSRPAIAPIPGLQDVPFLTNETLFQMKETPDHLIILGGGPIGVEMAQAHARMGIKVTIVEAMQILGKDDPELVEFLRRRLQKEGIEVLENSPAQEVKQKDRNIIVRLHDGRDLVGTHLLVATGRAANIETLDLETAGIAFGAKGIHVDKGLRTTNKRVYAIGDVSSPLQFTHSAAYEAGLVLRNALFGLRVCRRTHHIPWVTFSDPELAQVGFTEAGARQKYGDRLKVSRFSFSANDRAIAEAQSEGMIKLLVVRGRPVGVSIVGHGAGELIAFWSFVIAQRIKLSKLPSMITPYPTLSEVNARVVGAYFSNRLFENIWIKRVVRFVQKRIP